MWGVFKVCAVSFYFIFTNWILFTGWISKFYEVTPVKKISFHCFLICGHDKKKGPRANRSASITKVCTQKTLPAA